MDRTLLGAEIRRKDLSRPGAAGHETLGTPSSSRPGLSNLAPPRGGGSHGRLFTLGCARTGLPWTRRPRPSRGGSRCANQPAANECASGPFCPIACRSTVAKGPGAKRSTVYWKRVTDVGQARPFCKPNPSAIDPNAGESQQVDLVSAATTVFSLIGFVDPSCLSAI